MEKIPALILAVILALGAARPSAAQEIPDGKTMLIIAAGAAAAWALVQADKTPPLPTRPERTAADVASWATVAADVALDTRASWECPDRARCLERQGLRTAAVYTTVFAAKIWVHRDRPCAPDCGIDRPDTSFFSGHTALAFSTLGGPRLAVALPLAISTGGLRVAAGKHFVSDVLMGALVGAATSRIR